MDLVGWIMVGGLLIGGLFGLFWLLDGLLGRRIG